MFVSVLRPNVIEHEFLHTMGAQHEQNRPDRNDFVQILWFGSKTLSLNFFLIIKFKQLLEPFFRNNIDPASYSAYSIIQNDDWFDIDSRYHFLDIKT